MKKVGQMVYVHRSCLSSVKYSAIDMIQRAIPVLPSHFKWNIIRFHAQLQKISFLFYPDFDTDPHPSLTHAMTVDLDTMTTKYYEASKTNPPILHRKETFLDPSHENYQIFSGLTKEEEKAGLLGKSILHRIGHKRQWEELLKSKGFRIIDHKLQAVTEIKER